MSRSINEFLRYLDVSFTKKWNSIFSEKNTGRKHHMVKFHKVHPKTKQSQTILKISTFNQVKRQTPTHSVWSTLSLNIILFIPFHESNSVLEEQHIKLKIPNQQQQEKEIICLKLLRLSFYIVNMWPGMFLKLTHVIKPPV